MKKMSCKQLGGACDLEFLAETFEEMAMQSKKHGMEMFQNGDLAHMEAMNEMQNRMKTPADFAQWFENKRLEFDALDDN